MELCLPKIGSRSNSRRINNTLVDLAFARLALEEKACNIGTFGLEQAWKNQTEFW